MIWSSRRAAACLHVSPNEIGHRVAHVLVVLVLAWCGTGKAHAQSSTGCQDWGQCTEPQAYQSCQAGLQLAIAVLANQGGYDPQCVRGYDAANDRGAYLCKIRSYMQHDCRQIHPNARVAYYFNGQCASGINTETGQCNLSCPNGYSEDPWNPGQCLVPTKSLGGESCSTPGTHCGNPINVATGNKYQREDDLRLSSLLYFARHYNSHAAARTDLLGHKWTHSYSRAVEYVSGPSGTQVANVGRPDGRRLRFTDSTGQWKADADVAATLVRRNGPASELLGWTFTPQDGLEVEEYDPLGRLLQIMSPDGRAVALTYNNGVVENNANDFRLTRVQAQDGRSLVFEYDTNRRISKITDPTGSDYVYGYDTAGNLVTVTYPGGTSRIYVYNESAYTSGANLPMALTGIVHDDTQRFATFTYAANGKAIATEHAGGVEMVSVQYNADGSASLTESLGQIQQRAFTTVLGVKKATSIVENCTGCATRSSSYSYDVNGYPNLVTDARGTTTDYNYNARGLVSQRIESANDASNKRTTQTDWHTTFAVPVERRTYDAAGVLVEREVWTYNSQGQVLTHSVSEW